MHGDREFALPDAARLGRVRLQVGSIDRVARFYREAVGLTVQREGDMASLAAGGVPLVLLEETPGAPERPRAAAGLFHVAIRVPSRGALGAALGRLRDHGGLAGASDHLVSEALYARDPEGNGVEVYRDRPKQAWPVVDDDVAMETLPLDTADLASAASAEDRLPAGTDVGHVHLEVTDLQRSEAFYTDRLGLGVRSRYGDSASFLAAGDYHHHVGLNVWNGRSAPAGESRGLAWFEFVLPDPEDIQRVRRHLERTGVDVAADGRDLRVRDPDGIGLRFTS